MKNKEDKNIIQVGQYRISYNQVKSYTTFIRVLEKFKIKYPELMRIIIKKIDYQELSEKENKILDTFVKILTSN